MSSPPRESPEACSLTAIIPAHNEEHCLEETVSSLVERLDDEGLAYEVLVVADHCDDGTEELLGELAQTLPRLRWMANEKPKGFGSAIETGIEAAQGEAVVLYMADGSDIPEDVVRFHARYAEGDVDAVFGTRFHPEGRVVDYPQPKLFLNRLANFLVKIVFRVSYNDTTNAFKLYRRSIALSLRPFLGREYNLTVELPLKIIIRKYRYAVIPNTWLNRKQGRSKFKINEMGSKYLAILAYCLLEKYLTQTQEP